jgi:hypothetical protein
LINKAKLSRTFRTWHRRLGLALLLWLLFVAVTGFLLNHSRDFGFDSKPLPTSVLAAVYGIESPETTSFYINGLWLSHVSGNQLYRDREPLGFCQGLKGTAEYQGEIYAACDETIYILTASGELIERINAGLGVPFPITGFGVCDELPCLEHGGQSYALNPTYLTWAETDTTLTPARAGETPQGLGAYLRDINSPPDFQIQRLVRDLHSGAFFGLGPWLMDLFAISLVAMSALGFSLWWSTRR